MQGPKWMVVGVQESLGCPSSDHTLFQTAGVDILVSTANVLMVTNPVRVNSDGRAHGGHAMPA